MNEENVLQRDKTIKIPASTHGRNGTGILVF